MGSTPTHTGYAPVNGLNMYYEIQGEGSPLVLLHGAYGWVDSDEPLLKGLAQTRQVIAVELQAHGRTADIDRPITYEHMADDVAALMGYLNIDRADIFGYSMGGAVAVQVALRHPERVRKLVCVSAGIASTGAYSEMYDMIETITPEVFAGSPMEEASLRLAPNPKSFPNLVEKLKVLDMTPFDWSAKIVQATLPPILIVIGDSDIVRPEHAVEMFRLFGGGVMGDLAGNPPSQFAILPNTNHMGMFLERADPLVALAVPFLDAPLPEAE